MSFLTGFSTSTKSMSISHLTIQNFKSIRHTELQFGDFTVLIGANAAGKTNIVQALKFLKDLVKEDVDNALSLQGGAKYLVNSQIQDTEAPRIESRFLLPEVPFEVNATYGALSSISYDLILDFLHSGILHSSTESMNSDVYIYPRSYISDPEERAARLGEYVYEQKKNQSLFEHIVTTIDRTNNIIYSHLDRNNKRQFSSTIPKPENYRGMSPLLHADDDLAAYLRDEISSIAIYDFSSRAMKQESSIIGRKELEPDGSNLTLVLKRIMEDEQKRHQFLLLLEYALPFIKNVTVEAANGRSLVALLTEKYDESFALPSVFFSEGTISVIALIIVLFFEEKSVVVIEEPERYVHPSLLAKLVELMKDASRNKQVIITTHSPEIVKHAGVENLLLVQRDKEGFTTASRPEDSNDVKVFLQNEIGLDDLFIDNLLGV